MKDWVSTLPVAPSMCPRTASRSEGVVSQVKQVLLLYSLYHQFLQQLLEGDELYTKVHHNWPSAESEGWTVVIMDRTSRFLWTLQCGQRDQELFTLAIGDICQVSAQTEDLTLLTDGERRHGNFLIEKCFAVSPGCSLAAAQFFPPAFYDQGSSGRCFGHLDRRFILGSVVCTTSVLPIVVQCLLSTSLTFVPDCYSR